MNTNLFNEIRAEITRLTSNTNIYVNRTEIDKLYEIYIFSSVIQSLRLLGCLLEARDSSDNATTNFEFRLSPGYIFSPTVSSSFVHITYNNKEYELHNGVRILGKASVLHELDVAIIERDEARRCRDNNIHPRQSKIKFFAECKFYGVDLPLYIGREYLGLCSEFIVRVKTIVSNVGSNNIHKLITSHKQTENFQLTPLKPTEIDIFIKWMTNELRQVL